MPCRWHNCAIPLAQAYHLLLGTPQPVAYSCPDAEKRTVCDDKGGAGGVVAGKQDVCSESDDEYNRGEDFQHGCAALVGFVGLEGEHGGEVKEACHCAYPRVKVVAAGPFVEAEEYQA